MSSQSLDAKKLYGEVDRVPGLFHIATSFLVVRDVPVIPLGSYLIREGTLLGSEIIGDRVPLNWRSVLTVYLRMLFGGVSLLCAFVGTLAAFESFPDLKVRVPWAAGTVATFVCVLYWKTMNLQWRMALLASYAYLVLTFSALWIGNQWVGALGPRNRPFSNEFFVLQIVAQSAAAAYALTSCLSKITIERAFRLAARLEIPARLIEDHFHLADPDWQGQ